MDSSRGFQFHETKYNSSRRRSAESLHQENLDVQELFLEGLPHLFYHRASWRDRLVPIWVLNAYHKETLA